MKVALKTFILFLFLIFSKFSFCQEPLITDAIQNKVVIGFPEISTNQLNDIKAEFLKYNQIVSAKYIYGNHNVMLITFNNNQVNFGAYYDLLKVITPFYDIEKCYFKITSAFDEITNGLTTEPIFQVK